MSISSFDDFVEQLESVRERGYIKTLRTGDTGVGYTLETLLDIEENNDERGDIRTGGRTVELKAAREEGSTTVTLFSKEPPKNSRPIWNESLLNQIGYEDDDGRTALYTTITTEGYSPQGLTLDLSESRVNVIHDSLGVCARYPRSYLRQKFTSKFPELVFVSAKTQGESSTEHYWYSDSKHLRGFDIDSFYSALESGDLVVETRLHKSDGSVRNHGTAWRIDAQKLPRLFNEQTDLFEEPFENVERTGQQLLTDFT